MDACQPEMNSLFKSVRFDIDKPADLHFADQRGDVTNAGNPFARKRYPTTSGRPDSTFIGHGCLGGYVEAKVASGQNAERFEFSRFDANKRVWWDKRKESNIPYWLYVQFGKRVHHDKYPKMALLMPVNMMLALEAESTRKSLSYAQAKEMDSYRLVWVPAQGFRFRMQHPFIEHYFRGTYGHTSIADYCIP